MSGGLEWVLLAYRLPREPSTPRIAVWRRLKRLGVAQLLDGLVALPAGARTREQLEWTADAIVEAGGSATVWIGHASTKAQDRTIAAGMQAAVVAEYGALVEAARAAAALGSVDRRRELVRLQRELHRVEERDHFPPPERELAERAVRDLAQRVDVPS